MRGGREEGGKGGYRGKDDDMRGDEGWKGEVGKEGDSPLSQISAARTDTVQTSKLKLICRTIYQIIAPVS